MKVGILSQWFPPETGPASIPGVLASGLVERGHDVTVLTGFPNYPTGELYPGYSMRPRIDTREDGYALRRVALFPNHSSRASGRILNYASFASTASTLGLSALKGIDVLWVYNSPATVALPMWLAKAKYRMPIVLHNMDMWPDSIFHTGFAPGDPSGVVGRILSRWVQEMYRQSRFVAYLSPAAGRELATRGVAVEKLKFAPTWVDERVFRPMGGSAERSRLGYSKDDIVLGYAGALGKAQGVTYLIRAVAALPPESPVKLLIAGSGTQQALVQDLADRHPDRVRFLGQVSHADAGMLTSAMDIGFVGLAESSDSLFAMPSKLTALLASGKPVLGMVDGDAATLIETSHSGYVVAPGDQKGLLAALDHLGGNGPQSLRSLGQAGHRYYDEHLSQKVCLDRMAELLARAVEPIHTSQLASSPISGRMSAVRQGSSPPWAG